MTVSHQHAAPSPDTDAQTQTSIRIDHITVRHDRIAFDITLEEGVPHHTNPDIAQRALRSHPHLANHACVNSRGNQFSSVIEHTSIPHLIEHLAIDELTQRMAQQASVHNGFVVTGTSEWIDQSAGRAHIELSCHDDIEVMAAFTKALFECARIVQ